LSEGSHGLKENKKRSKLMRCTKSRRKMRARRKIEAKQRKHEKVKRRVIKFARSPFP
jgi:hypothetical protein